MRGGVLTTKRLTQRQASEVITHLRFYAGWPNAFSALAVGKDDS
jgi:4-carboxymuconolactone decarboxylase